MPFRTRDFVLFLLTVAFLVVGITATAHRDLASRGQAAAAISFDSASSNEVVYEAVVPDARVIPRASRLAELREKIADFVFPAPSAEVEEIPAEAADEPVRTTAPGTITLCPGYRTASPAWSPAGLKFETVEGARLVYRLAEPTVTVDEFGVETVIPSRDIVAQLPLRTSPQGMNCLPTDIVGIALDGSLIRNNEHGLYRVFGEETVIGYALDGFPIHGVSTVVTDGCGGYTSGAGYRYVLSTERAGVLGCFSGTPVSL